MLIAIPTLLFITFGAFFLTTAARGDPVLILLEQSDQPATPELVAFYREQLGLNDPLPVRYLRWMSGVFQGDLGRSFLSQRPVTSMLAERVLPTIILGLSAFSVATVVGIALGALLAVTRIWQLDTFTRFGLSVASAIPSFWLAIGLIGLFGTHWRLLPVAGYGSWQHLMLPTLALTLGPLLVTVRLTRGTILDIVQEDYIRTAHAKGVGSRLILFRHILRNAALPLATFIGMRFGAILTGAAIIEAVFAWPGMGTVFITAIAGRDLPVIGGYLLLIGPLIIAVNLLTDLMCYWIDPRTDMINQRGMA
jgi:peptide/nickel transport system permease protein